MSVPDIIKNNEILNFLENEYMPKILGFAYLKTNSRDEAEDLAQEIYLQVIESVRRGKRIENIGAYVWTVANNVLCKKIRHRTANTCLELSELLKSDENIEDTYIKEETEASLRRMISMLSREYRNAVIMFYFDGMGVGDIAAEMKKSEGTVKWWLSESRKFIKDGMINMKEYGEKSYRPDTLTMSCQYNFGDNMEPMSCAKRKSAQNILSAAYEAPMSVEELSAELGISAPYIEDEVEFLTYNQLMKKTPSGKYQTDFVIMKTRGDDVIVKNYKECFPEYSDKLINFLESNREILESDDYNIGKFEWNRLLWVYIQMISCASEFRFKQEECGILTYKDIPDRPNNGHWIALGWLNGDKGIEQNLLDICPELKYFKYDGPCHHPRYDSGHFEQNFCHYWTGTDSSHFFDLKENVLILCKRIITGEIQIKDLDDDQKLIFSSALSSKLFIKDGDSYRQNYFFIYRNKYIKILEMSDEFYQSVVHLYRKAYKNILDTFKKEIPKHLHWQMVNQLTNKMVFVPCALYEANKKGILCSPDIEGREWLSLYQTN